MSRPADITLGVIVRDCAEDVQRLLRSIRPNVSEIVVADTGSVDGTWTVAKEEGADQILDASYLLDSDGYLTSFSDARQLTLDSASCSWYMWLDTDDEYLTSDRLPLLIESLERERNTKEGASIAGCLDYAYTWQEGRCTQRFKRERIICRNDGWEWKRPVHEALHPRSKAEFVDLTSIGGEVRHRSHTSFDQRNGTDRNWRILKRWEQNAKTNEDKKTVFYYIGDEHLARKNFALAAKYFKQCLDAEGDFAWPERAAYRYLICLHNLNLYKLVIHESTVYESLIQNSHSMLMVADAKCRMMQAKLFSEASSLPLLEGEDPNAVQYLFT